MRFFIVFASVFLAITTASDIELWSEFKKNHGRNYKNLKEERERFSIFQQNLRIIDQHNEKYDKGETTYYMGINKFTDLTPQEFQSMLNHNKIIKPTSTFGQLHKHSGTKLPSEVNWVTEGVVTEVKNQGECGACWAFAAVGSIESQYAIKTGEVVSLSEQNVVDCSGYYGYVGCHGGIIDVAFMYVRDIGIETTSDYPYIDADGRCAFNESLSVLNLSGYVDIPIGDENSLQDAIATVGPVAVAVNADDYQYYSGGVYDNSSCSQEVNHGVLVVGYGVESETEYYLIKNSYGVEFGENGYIKMARNKDSQCGITKEASYPILA